MRPTRSPGPQGPARRPARRPSGVRRTAGLSALVLAVLATAGCSRDDTDAWLRGGFPEPVTEQGRTILTLWQGTLVAALVVGVIVWGLILWSCVRYRKRSDELPRQVRYNLPIEILYTAVPFVIIAVLFYYTVLSQNYVNELTEEDDPDYDEVVNIGVVGFQWNWQFNYVGENLQVTGRPGQPAELVLPTNRTIRFIETSPDVIHSFWVPAFLFKRDVIPGRYNQFEIRIDTPGSFIGRCAEYCGVDHNRMNFAVRALPPEEYDAFLASSRGAASTAATDAAGTGGAPTGQTQTGDTP